jgi:hypothetical protein
VICHNGGILYSVFQCQVTDVDWLINTWIFVERHDLLSLLGDYVGRAERRLLCGGFLIRNYGSLFLRHCSHLYSTVMRQLALPALAHVPRSYCDA